jgi:hypothetical protein
MRFEKRNALAMAGSAGDKHPSSIRVLGVISIVGLATASLPFSPGFAEPAWSNCPENPILDP